MKTKKRKYYKKFFNHKVIKYKVRKIKMKTQSKVNGKIWILSKEEKKIKK